MRGLGALAATGLWGLCIGTAVGVATALAERYPQLGFHRLALEALTGSALAYLAVGLVSGVAAVALTSLGVLAARRLGGWATRPAGAAAWVIALLPACAWLAVRDRWLLPLGRAETLAVLIAIACAVGAAYALTLRLRLQPRIGGWLRRLVPPVAALGALLLVAGLAAQALLGHRAAARTGQPNVLLIVLDTVRADRLSSYGYPRPTTPELDRFAREALRFTEFYSTSCWTIPSHASLFTGLFPIRHDATQETLRLPREHGTLAELLREAGYQTFAASGNPFVGADTNLHQGFARFVDSWRAALEPGTSPGDPHPNNAALGSFLREARRDRPFFVFLNYMDAHSPYTPPEPYRSRFLRSRAWRGRAASIVLRRWTGFFLGERFTARDLAILSDLYDGEIAHLSHVVGQALERLREDGRYDETLIAIVSDHGEHFGENGLIQHMFGLYNTTVRIPLLLRLPGGARAGAVDARPAQLVDLFATIAAAAGADTARLAHHGIDVFDAQGSPGRETVFSEYYFPRQVLSHFTPDELERHGDRLAPYQRRLRALQTGGRRLIWSSDGRHELYDLTADPGESRDLLTDVGSEAEIRPYLERLEALVARYRGDRPERPLAGPGEEPDFDEAAREALRALGYVR